MTVQYPVKYQGVMLQNLLLGIKLIHQSNVRDGNDISPINYTLTTISIQEYFGFLAKKRLIFFLSLYSLLLYLYNIICEGEWLTT